MQVRSPPLLALGLALLAGSTALGAILVHDGEAPGEPLSKSEAGDAVVVKGHLVPFQLAFTRAAAWADATRVLGNVTYVLVQDDPALLVLVTGERSAPPGEETVVEGRVALAGPHPEDPSRQLVVVAAHAFRAPLVFR